tara:strand:- start:1465 stop:1896 length:432 start_codon:yes stop_codon:yes gene_type:complete
VDLHLHGGLSMKWFNVFKEDVDALPFKEIVARVKLMNQYTESSEQKLIAHIHDQLDNHKKYLIKLVEKYNEKLPDALEPIKLPDGYQVIELPDNKYMGSNREVYYEIANTETMINRIAMYNVQVIIFKNMIQNKDIQRQAGLI